MNNEWGYIPHGRIIKHHTWGRSCDSLLDLLTGTSGYYEILPEVPIRTTWDSTKATALIYCIQSEMGCSKASLSAESLKSRISPKVVQWLG